MALGPRRKAEKRHVKFRGALSGPAGSGKTLSALKVARGLVGPEGRITVIDTERNSAELYADRKRFPELGDFDVIEFTPPYTAAMYREAIREAKAGSDAIIIDSLSPAWTGQGGMLEKHGTVTEASRSKNSWEAWRKVTPDHDRLVDEMLGCDVHLFVTMRTKTEWVLEKDSDGKSKPVKIGLEPRFREGIDYEFTIVWDIRQEDHYAVISKNRTDLFGGFCDLLSIRTGEDIRDWANSGAEAAAPTPTAGDPPSNKPTDAELLAKLLAALDGAQTGERVDELMNSKGAQALKERLSEENQQLLCDTWAKSLERTVVPDPEADDAAATENYEWPGTRDGSDASADPVDALMDAGKFPSTSNAHQEVV